ncbi:hypothetical protein [Clostridium sp. BJN0001]|uniref:hypothetical protein n=1 Tax=Clostridium sp. BJN0001 TaxID=2930219 RepID=UPI001FD5FC07|nr:hypothetical protein [Clostridium sp. BJN0001]
MSIILSDEEKLNETRDFFLKIFQEEGVPKEDLKEAILNSYIDRGYNYKTFNDIPQKEMEFAVLDCYEAAGYKFDKIEDIVEYYRNK